jgi:hypothetical protein
MCEPPEESQFAITAHRGAVQALCVGPVRVRKSSRWRTRGRGVSERKLLPPPSPEDQARPYEVCCGRASGGAITEAICEAGFNASTRFFESSTDMLGMRLSRCCAGAANEEINSPSAKRSWAPCRLRRPRSVAATRRAAPRGDQSTFPQRAGASCTFARHGRAGPLTTRARF